MSEPSSPWISIDRSGVSTWARAVDMGAERDALLVELAQLGQRHDLESAAVREDRIGPAHEFVQPAEPGERSAPGRSIRW